MRKVGVGKSSDGSLGFAGSELLVLFIPVQRQCPTGAFCWEVPSTSSPCRRLEKHRTGAAGAQRTMKERRSGPA